jgi:hypothetical protein
MRVLDDERFQFGVPALEAEVAPHQIADLGLEPLVARLEPPDLLREVIDSALLHVGVWRSVESLPPEYIFKEPEESARPLEPSLIDLEGHPSGQVRQHLVLPSGEKSEASGKGVLYF